MFLNKYFHKHFIPFFPFKNRTVRGWKASIFCFEDFGINRHYSQNESVSYSSFVPNNILETLQCTYLIPGLYFRMILYELIKFLVNNIFRFKTHLIILYIHAQKYLNYLICRQVFLKPYNCYVKFLFILLIPERPMIVILLSNLILRLSYLWSSVMNIMAPEV